MKRVLYVVVLTCATRQRRAIPTDRFQAINLKYDERY